MTRPALELPIDIHDEGESVWLDINVPASARMEWLLNLYILRYDQEPFGVTVGDRRRITTRIVMHSDVEHPGRAEWGHDQLFLILAEEELDYWIHAYRRWYQGKWDTFTPPHLDVS